MRRSDFYLAMDDSVLLDVALFEPTKTAPDSGFPAVVLVHGLGGDKEDMADAAQLFVALDGYVALSYSVRGQGNSGGLRTFSGERERQDLRTILEWLASRPNVNGRRIGIVGGSQGGQHAWWAALYGMPVRAVAAAAGYLGDLTSNGCIEVGVLGVLSSSHVRYGPV
ncbi:MAG TPA: alpha/beta fold hydrolase, partial [Bacteroidetes bacterium]|nr:alpha/beta fold hydrolase [Bacteroidota bacterium]